MVDVPAVVRNKAVGAGAERWLDDLDDLVAECGLTVVSSYDEETEAIVLGVDLAGAVAAWEWALPRVSTGLLCASIDRQPEGRHMLRAADAVAGLSGVG